MNSITKFAILGVFMLSISGCATRHAQPQQPIEPQPNDVERSVEVEEGSMSDYAVRGAHGAIEAGQASVEAGEDAWQWMKDKKRKAKKWVHEATEE